MNDTEAARALYKNFSTLFEHYDNPRGFSGNSDLRDFDYYKFLGHELLATLIAKLIDYERYETIATHPRRRRPYHQSQRRRRSQTRHVRIRQRTPRITAPTPGSKATHELPRRPLTRQTRTKRNVRHDHGWGAQRPPAVRSTHRGNDLWIAASAMQSGLRVLTLDAHFQRVPRS